MPMINREALVPYSATEMYDLVNAVESYKDFLPWCVESKVLNVEDNKMLGELTLGQSGIYKSFITRNQLVPPHKIILDLVEGPFDALEGQWSFSTLGNQGCKVSLALRFEFNSVLLEQAFSAIFTKMTNSLVEAFCKRAKEIYGERSLF